MYTSTQSIESPTKDMRNYALSSTIAVWVGALLLIGTLWFTYHAINVMRDIGNAQVRAYLGLSGAKLAKLKDGNIYVIIAVKNCGSSPATNVSYKTRKSVTLVDMISECIPQETPFDTFEQDVAVGAISPGATQNCTCRVSPFSAHCGIDETIIVTANISLNYSTLFDKSPKQFESFDARIAISKIRDHETWEMPMQVG